MLLYDFLFFVLMTTLIDHALAKCCCVDNQPAGSKATSTKTPVSYLLNFFHHTFQSLQNNLDYSGPREYNTRDDYLNGHNYYRGLIRNGMKTSQPRSSNLNNLVWNTTLERKAYEMSLRCYFKHEESGENLYAGTSLSLDPLMKWFDEQLLYTYKPISSTDFHNYGHYTQMVWAKTTSVGCWRNTCSPIRFSNGQSWERAYYTVCKYYPP
ncbi:hypothetical protein FBUS_08154 [Fasciolopsis buskii]|uniref:SCP domain-containing protein n=1 Tax=Fasciolopsis buskii TaxID=27845 RepID=A0A8E0RUZ6_9TREM|nr:hypothetical protein FBUS_08154 [Fasciolopsis buski]